MPKPSFQAPPRVDEYMVKFMEDGSMAWWRLYSEHKKTSGKRLESQVQYVRFAEPLNAGLWTNGRGNKSSTYHLVKQYLITSRHYIILNKS